MILKIFFLIFSLKTECDSFWFGFTYEFTNALQWQRYIFKLMKYSIRKFLSFLLYLSDQMCKTTHQNSQRAYAIYIFFLSNSQNIWALCYAFTSCCQSSHFFETSTRRGISLTLFCEYDPKNQMASHVIIRNYTYMH